jgi:hypothetical protein
LGLLLLLVAFTRPEGIVYGAVIWLALAIRCLVRWRRVKGSVRAPVLGLLRFGLVLGLPFVAMVLARWFYFHDVAPNPYYAKIGDRIVNHSFVNTLDVGWIYVRDGIRAQSWHLLVPLAIFSFAALRRFEIVALWCLTLASVVLPVYARGDWMMEHRLLSPLFPLYLLAALVGWNSLSIHVRAESQRGFRVLTAGLAVCVLLVGTLQGIQRSGRAKAKPTLGMRTAEAQARAVRQYADGLGLEHVTVLIPDVGGSSYFGTRHGVEVLDLGGLGSRFTGRLGLGPHIWEYVLEELKPDFMGFHIPWSDGLGIQLAKEFYDLYQPTWEDWEPSVPGREGQRLRSGFYVRRDLVTADANTILRPASGPELQGLRFRGWGGPQVTRQGHVRVTTYWEVTRRLSPPTLELEWATTDGAAKGSKTAEFAGGCYSADHVRRGDILLSAVVLDSLPETAINQSLVFSMTAKREQLWTPISLGTEVPAPAPIVDSAKILAQGRERIAAGNLEGCLDLVLAHRDQTIPALDPELRRLQRELAHAFYARAQEQEDSAELLTVVPRVWRDAWNAWRAWKGFSPALVKVIDYWPLRQMLRGPQDAISASTYAVSWSESTTLFDVYRGLASSIFPFHDLRLAPLRDRILEPSLPVLSDDVVHLQGWLPREGWGRWLVEETAHLYVQNPIPSRVRVRACSWPEMSEPQWVNAYYEGEYLGSKWIDERAWEMNDYDFILPAQPAQGVLSLKVKQVFLDPPPSEGQRALAVGSIEVIPVPTRE